MLSENAIKLLAFMSHERTTNGKTSFAPHEFLGVKAISPITLNEIDIAIEELYSKGMIDIANNIASTVSMTEYGFSIANHR